jgi:hypothetical protein
VAAYRHTSMLKIHFQIADALAECLAKLQSREIDSLKLTLRSVVKLREKKLEKPQLLQLSETSDEKKKKKRGTSMFASIAAAEEDEYERDWTRSVNPKVTPPSSSKSNLDPHKARQIMIQEMLNGGK